MNDDVLNTNTTHNRKKYSIGQMCYNKKLLPFREGIIVRDGVDIKFVPNIEYWRK